jgi:ribonucleotide reductase alpha subunit
MSKTNAEIFKDEFSEEVWKSTYKDYLDESIDCTFKRVAKSAASVEKTDELKEEWYHKFYEMLCDFTVTCGGRIYANAGTSHKGTTLINCYTGGRPSYDCDSLSGILQVLLEQSLTLKSEGGWGLNFSFIRPRGSLIKGIGVESPGAVKYMEIFDKSSEIITAGSGINFVKTNKKKNKIRKGAQMAILNIEHPDAEEFITAKQTPGRLSKFNMSINCSNSFMDKVSKAEEIKSKHGIDEARKIMWDFRYPDTEHEKYKSEWDGNIEKWEKKGYKTVVFKSAPIIDIWNLITESTYNRAEPGVLFLDRANEKYLFNYGSLEIQETNACQPKSATVLTPGGIKTFGDINEGDLIWSADGWTKVSKKWSNGMREVYKYKTTSGFFLGTDDHRLVENGTKKEAKECESVDTFSCEFLSSINIDPQDVMDGLVLGDGSVHKASNNLVFLCIGEKDQDYFNSEISSLIGKDRRAMSDTAYEIKTTITAEELPKTYNRVIPSRFFNGNRNKVCGFLRGLFTANGGICGDRVSLKQTSFAVIEQVQLMLSYLGINSYYTTNKPSTIKFSNGDYTCKQSYDLNICADKDKFFKIIGFIQSYKNEKLHSLILNKQFSTNKRIKNRDIKSIELISEEEVFHITVDNESHTYWTGGCNVSNCSEQTMPPFSSCNLISINLTQFIGADNRFDFDKLEKFSRIALRFSDNINDLTYAPLPEYIKTIKELRRVGVGIMGWGSLLYMLKVKFASNEAEQLKEKIMSKMCFSIIDESANLAAEKGMFVGCEPEKQANVNYFNSIGIPNELKNKIRKNGIRNSSLFSIQPTGNTSILANVVSGGCEPIFMHEYIRTVIIPECPKDLLSVCPKYWEGEFIEFGIFKFAKEGDETILRAVKDGVTYKIDKGRGLTKEVLCQDYAVRELENRGEWNPSAEWAKTTVDISVEDHITDLKGFTRWLDASCSKTINIPNDYPFEKFSNVYLDAYKTGTIKGITTYRAGTMTAVLSSKEEPKEVKSAIKKTTAPKRPKELDCTVEHLTSKGVKYYGIVGLMDGEPYEVFTGTNEKDGIIFIPKSVTSGKIVKNSRGNYSLVSDEEKFDLTNGHSDSSADALTRMISTSLRHGADISFIVHQLEKTEGEMTCFARSLSRALKKCIKDGTIVHGETCSNCGSHNIIRSESCKKCGDCGSSQCG